MKRKVIAHLYIVVMLGVIVTAPVSGRIIPVAEQALTHAEPYLHSDVIILNPDEDWELNLPGSSEPLTIPTTDGKTIPAFEKGKPNQNAVPYEHSPAIDPGWVLTVPPDPAETEIPGTDTLTALNDSVLLSSVITPNDVTQLEGVYEGSMITMIPEPSTLIVLSLGTVLIKRRR